MSPAYRSVMSDNDVRPITKPPPGARVRDTEYLRRGPASRRIESAPATTGPMSVVDGSAP